MLLVKGRDVGPFLSEGAVEPFGFAVGLGPVAAGEPGLGAEFV